MAWGQRGYKPLSEAMFVCCIDADKPLELSELTYRIEGPLSPSMKEDVTYIGHRDVKT